jgi:hypothetical protein
MTPPVSSLRVITGEVIPVSRQKGWVNALFGLVIAALGAGALFLKWYWIGFGGIFVGVVYGAALGLTQMFSTERLIVGDDSFQEVKGEEKVLSHVPFANIAEIRYVEHLPPFVGINLVDTGDPNSFAETSFGSLKDHHGFDYVLVDSYTVEPKEVFGVLMVRYKAYQDTRGNA